MREQLIFEKFFQRQGFSHNQRKTRNDVNNQSMQLIVFIHAMISLTLRILRNRK